MTHVLKPYPARKDSGLEWLGEVPEHWEIQRLKNVAEMRISNIDKHTKEGEYPVRLCNYVDVYKNDHISPSMLFMRATATADEIARFRLTPGDVLITKDSEAWDDIGVPALVVESADDLVSGYHLALLRPLGTCLNGGYLLRALQSRSIGCQFHVQANGVTRYGLSHAAIQSVWLPLPPLPEQTAIVRFLDYVDRRIQRYIRAKEKLIALLEEQKQAIIHQAVTGQVDVRTGQPYRAYKDSDVEWLGQVPEHWDVVRNGRLFVQRNEVGFAELPILEISLRTGIRVRDLEDPDRKQVMSDRNKYKRAVEGDIAYNMMRMWQGAVGVTPVDGLVSPAYVVAKPLVGTNPQYFNALFRTSAYMTEIDKYPRGIVKDRNRLYWEDFKRMPTPRPPQEEQVLIADFNDSNVVTIDQEVCQLERQIHFLKEYRTRLVADVVTGKLDVRDAAAALPKVDPLAGDDVDDPVDTDMDSVLEELETVKEVAR